MKKIFGLTATLSWVENFAGKTLTSAPVLPARALLPVALLATGLLSACAQAQETIAPQPLVPLPASSAKPVPHVIHISVDALGSKYLEKFLQEAPTDFNNFGRLIKEGASTLNARTDYTHTITLPNHTCMVTGRPVKTPDDWQEARGHFWEWNSEFPSDKAAASLHATNPDGGYTASSFDVAHDNGLTTAMYSGKAKFELYPTSFGEKLGAEHTRGRKKIDFSIISNVIHDKALADLKLHHAAYTFLHYPEPDVAGHAFGYLGAEYRDSVKKVDGFIGDLLNLVDNDPEWKNRTVIVLSADHGGEPGTKGHGNASHTHNYTIPFIVWGTGVAKGADLYKLNLKTRLDPGEGRPVYSPTDQPIRNGDGGNLSLQLLGLPAIPGSHINNKQDLNVR